MSATVYHERDCERTPCLTFDGVTTGGEHTCGGTWQCATCGRLFGFCHGAHLENDTEQENGSCDECWAALKREAERKRDWATRMLRVKL